MKRDQETSGSGASNKRGARSGMKPASSAPSRVSSVLNLQRTAGNRAVSSRLSSAGAPIPIQRDYAELERDLGVGDTSELVEALRDVIGNSKSPTALAGKLRGNLSTNKTRSETPAHGGDSTDSTGKTGGYTPTTPVTAKSLEQARQKAYGEHTPDAEDEKAVQQARYTQIAGIRTFHQKLFGAKLDKQQVDDLVDIKKTSDEDFSTIASRYKTLGPLADKYKRAYHKEIHSGTLKVNGNDITLQQLMSPTTSEEDFATFESEVTAKTKSVTDAESNLKEIKTLEADLEKSDLHLHPKSDAELSNMTPQKQATYLKYLKKKADDVNADVEDTFAQQEMNKLLLKGGVKTKEQRAEERAAKK